MESLEKPKIQKLYNFLANYGWVSTSSWELQNISIKLRKLNIMGIADDFESK